MKNFNKFLGIAVIVAAIGFSMTGCTTITVVDPVETKWIQPNPRDFIVLGVVEFQQNQRKGISYADMLNHARESFPTANAVLDIRIESVTRQVGIVSRSVFVATGIAIQYVSTAGN